MLIPFCLVFRVLSSTLLPALPRPCILGTTRESATLCPFSLRGLLVESVYCRLWQHQRQDRRASLGKTHHLPISRPASCRFGSPDIRSRLITPARPPHQHHIAGSLFATYTGSASCFLQTPHFWLCPCLVGVVLPSGNGGPSCSRLSSGPAACASCQAHINSPAASGRGIRRAPAGYLRATSDIPFLDFLHTFQSYPHSHAYQRCWRNIHQTRIPLPIAVSSLGDNA